MYTNAYHIVSTGKLATQWYNQLFSHINRVTSMDCVKWLTVNNVKGQPAFLDARTLNPEVVNIQPNRLYYNVNYDYKSFMEKLNKPDDNYIGLYIYRDPREYVMSAYYSWMYSHPGGHEKRKHISQLSKEDGLKYVIDQTQEWNEWTMIRSWGESDNSKIIKLKFEDIFGSDEKQNKMIDYINTTYQLGLTDEQLNDIKSAMTYDKFSGGRKHGDINNNHHYRSGGKLTYKTEMSDNVLKHFEDVTGDLINVLGYE